MNNVRIFIYTSPSVCELIYTNVCQLIYTNTNAGRIYPTTHLENISKVDLPYIGLNRISNLLASNTDHDAIEFDTRTYQAILIGIT